MPQKRNELIDYEVFAIACLDDIFGSRGKLDFSELPSKSDIDAIFKDWPVLTCDINGNYAVKCRNQKRKWWQLWKPKFIAYVPPTTYSARDASAASEILSSAGIRRLTATHE